MLKTLAIALAGAALTATPAFAGNGNGTGGTAPPEPTSTNAPVQHGPSRRATPSSKVTHRVPLVGLYNYGDGFGVDRPGHMHQGIDLLAPKGTPIVAPRAGVITRVAYQEGGAGYYVVLSGSREQLDYVFMHMVKGSTRVAEGQTVKMGQRIGDLGSTGASSGPHLHFEIWKGTWAFGGKPVDPLPYLKSWAASARKASRNR
jgi:murein DD-endopeptidase MepM/ murein hydrolase activator NlpD